MAKKRVSGVDLVWLILEQMDDGSGSRATRMSIAVIPDDKLGWRAVVGRNDRRFVTPEFERRFTAIQNRLRLTYDLRY